MDFDLFDGMKVDELKSYLRLRGLKVSGKKSILVARAYAAHENNAPVVMTAEEVEAELKVEYDGKFLQRFRIPFIKKGHTFISKLLFFRGHLE